RSLAAILRFAALTERLDEERRISRYSCRLLRAEVRNVSAMSLSCPSSTIASWPIWAFTARISEANGAGRRGSLPYWKWDADDEDVCGSIFRRAVWSSDASYHDHRPRQVRQARVAMINNAIFRNSWRRCFRRRCPTGELGGG